MIIASPQQNNIELLISYCDPTNPPPQPLEIIEQDSIFSCKNGRGVIHIEGLLIERERG